MAASSAVNATELLNQIERLTKERPSELLADHGTRTRLRDAARNLSIAMEGRNDIVHRIGHMPLQSAMARLGTEIKLFDILAESDSPLTSKEIAVRTGVDPSLMDRYLRYYASYGMISEVGQDGYAASNVSTAMVNPGYKAGISYFFETITPTYMKLGQYMRETGYKDPTNGSFTPWHLAHNTSLSPFQWLKSHPDHYNYFVTYMKTHREGLAVFLDAYPFEERLCQNIKPENPLFIDIGGSTGQQIKTLRQRWQGPGRVILQDQPEVIKQAMDIPGMEPMAYDFWTPQPIKGCRAYYMRNILHDWPDDKCVEILRNTMSAMTSESVLLIDEMVMPERGAHWRAAHIDLMMMTCLAARERTERQWQNLLDAAGLKIKKIWVYTTELRDSLIEAVPK